MAYRLNLKDSADALDIDVLEIPLADDFVEGASDNTTLDGNIYTDYLYLKKQYSYKWATMDAETYDRLKGFYTRQWSSKKYPYFTLSDLNTTQDIRAETHATFYGAPIEYSNGIILNSYEIYGDTEQTMTTGKNLIEPQNGTAQGITSSYNEQTGAVTFSGTSNTTYTVPPAFAKTYEPGTYTLTIDSPQQVRVGVGFWTGTSSSTRKTFAIQAGQTKATYELAEPAQQADVFLTGLTSGTTYNLTVKVMLEKGAGSANFEPYTAGASPNPTYPQEVKNVTGRTEFKINVEGVYNKTVEINLGKNLFDKAKTNTGYYLDGTTGRLVVSTTSSTSDFIKVSGSTTYTLHSGSDGYKRVCFYADNTADSIISSVGTEQGNANYTFTTASSCKYIRFQYRTTYENVTQLERGNSYTQFSRYFEPIELCKIGNYQDRIYKSGWRWFIERNVGSWTMREIDTGSGMTWEGARKRLYCSLNWQQTRGINFIAQPDPSAPALIISDRFISKSFNDLYNSGSDGLALSTSTTLSFRNNAWTDGDTAKASIVGTTFYYAMATPVTEEITDSELIMQLESIPYSYLGNMPGVISLTASNGMVAPLSADINYWYYEHMPTPIYNNRPVRMELSDDGVVDCCGTRQGVKITLRETRQQ